MTVDNRKCIGPDIKNSNSMDLFAIIKLALLLTKKRTIQSIKHQNPSVRLKYFKPTTMIRVVNKTINQKVTYCTLINNFTFKIIEQLYS